MAYKKSNVNTKASQKSYYYSANDFTKRKRRRSAKKRKLHKGSQAYLDMGFYKNFNEEERKENYFFVLNNGMSSGNGRITTSAAKKIAKNTGRDKAIQALKQAQKVNETAEIGFLKEFTSNFKKSGPKVQERVAESLQEYGLKDIFLKDSYDAKDVETFFNSPLFNGTKMLTRDVDSQIFGSDIFDQFYTKIHDASFGFRNAIKKANNFAEAKQLLGDTIDKYLFSMGKNTVTGKEGLGALLGNFNIDDEETRTFIKEQLIIGFLDESMQIHDDADFDKALLASKNKGGEFNIFSDNYHVHGPFAEQIVGLLTQLLSGKQIQLAGGETAIFAVNTGRDAALKNSSTFKDLTGASGGTKDGQGRTDIKLFYDIDNSHKASFQINVTNKMVLGYSHSETEKGKLQSKASKRAHMYGGGQLASALDRISNSSLFDRGGLLTEQDLDDLVFLIVNAAQGGIYQQARDQIIETFQALQSFLAFDEMANNLGMSELAKGEIDEKAFRTGPIIVNLININGYYIPASYFFQSIIKLLSQSQNKAWSAYVTFANTFPESIQTGRSYIQGYEDWIYDNGLVATTSMNKVKKGAGDPYKVRNNIFKNTTLGGFNIKWSGSIDTFWQQFGH